MGTHYYRAFATTQAVAFYRAEPLGSERHRRASRRAKLAGASESNASNAYNHAALVIAFVILHFIIRFLRRSLDVGGLFSSDFVLANLRGNQ